MHATQYQEHTEAFSTGNVLTLMTPSALPLEKYRIKSAGMYTCSHLCKFKPSWCVNPVN